MAACIIDYMDFLNTEHQPVVHTHTPDKSAGNPKFVADTILFFFFPEKISLDNLCESSAKWTIHMKCQGFFFVENKTLDVPKLHKCPRPLNFAHMAKLSSKC